MTDTVPRKAMNNPVPDTNTVNGERRSIRVFISSPSDVRPERLIAERVVQRLDREFAYHFSIEAKLWEREPLVAGAHFQDGIVAPRETDIVVVILWSRLGLTLPADKYRGALTDGPVTGTEWEFEDALASYQKQRLPDLLLYRKTAEITSSLADETVVRERLDQKRLVEDFMTRWTRSADGSGFTAASWDFADAAAFEEQLETHLRALIRRRLTTTEEGPAGIRWHQGSPFRGLQSFELEHAPVFFGRTRARNEVRELLARRAERGAAFVLVLGASGSGKSSLVKAGVLADLKLPGMIGRVALCRHAILRPSDGGGGDPIGALAAALLADEALPELAGLQYDTPVLTGQLRDNPKQVAFAVRQGLAAAGKAAQLTEIAEARLLVVVDQLEELFTLDGITPAEREGFVAALAALAHSGLVWVIATLRSDLFDRLETAPALLALAGDEARYLLAAPTDGELGQIITRPAREAGVRFEADEVRGSSLDDVLREAAGRDRDALPLLSYVLDLLWQHRRPVDGMLTFAAYEELGGLNGAIGRRAEDVFTALQTEVQAAFPQVLRALVAIGQGAEDRATARSVARTIFAPGSPADALVTALLGSQARLLVADGAAAWVRVAHEAVLTHWERARRQIAEDRKDLQLRGRLEQAAALWEAAAVADRPALLLNPGLPLSEGEDLLVRRREELAAAVVAFVATSGTTARAAERRRMLRLRAVAAGFAVLASGAGVGAWLGFTGQNEAIRQAGVARQRTAEVSENLAQAQIAQSRFLAAKAEDLLKEHDPELATFIADAALPRDLAQPNRPVVAEAMTALRQAVLADRGIAVMTGHTGAIEVVAFSPDGSLILTTSEDVTPRLWDGLTGTPVALLRGHTDKILSAVFGPDGKQVATASLDGTARLWDAATGAQIRVLKGHEGALWSVAFSPDGRHLVTGSSDKSARIWDAETGACIAVLKGHTDTVFSAAFSPDGKRIITGASEDPAARVWDTRNGTEMFRLDGHRLGVHSATFSPDGHRMLTRSIDEIVRVWDAETGTEVKTLPGRIKQARFSPDGKALVTGADGGVAQIWDTDRWNVLREVHHSAVDSPNADIRSVAFSLDGRRILTASEDKTTRVWDARNGTLISVFQPADDCAAFSPDGRRVVTASYGTARLWDADNGPTLRGHRGGVSTATFSRDGTRVLTAAEDGFAVLWSARDGSVQTVFSGHASGVKSAAFSPDERHVVTASADHTARVWDADSGAQLAVLAGHGNTVESARFSPDGQRIVTASWDGTARIWDAGTGAQLIVLKSTTGTIKSAAFSPDGTRVLTTLGTKVKYQGSSVEGLHLSLQIWDAATGSSPVTMDGGSLAPSPAPFSPDGRLIAAAYDECQCARVLNAADGTEITRLVGHEHGVGVVAFSPDGQRVVTVPGDNSSNDKSARVWDARTGALVAELIGHTGAPTRAAFSPDGSRVLTLSYDFSVRVWDARDGTQLARLDHDTYVDSAEFSPDGRSVVTATVNSEVRLWSVARLMPGVEPYYSRAAALTRFSSADRDRFFLGEEKQAVSAASTPSAKCDLLAAYYFDPGNTTGRGVYFRHIKPNEAIPACRKAVEAEPNTPRLRFQLGMALWLGGRLDEAFGIATATCRAPYAAACELAGILTQIGAGTTPDAPGAAVLYRHAIALGSISAAYNLGVLLWSGAQGVDTNRTEALSLLARAADGGVPNAHAALAKVYQLGKDVERDAQKALFHHATAAHLFAAADDPDDADLEAALRGALARTMDPLEVARIWHDQVMPWKKSESNAAPR